MKKLKLSTSFLLLCCAWGQQSFAQEIYGHKVDVQRNAKVPLNNFYNPNYEPIYTVDSTINHVDFGKQDNKRAIVTLFPFKSITKDNPSKFDFKPSQIRETRMTNKERITKVELTPNGFEVTFNPKKVKGAVDEYIGIYTDYGTMFLWLTGEIIVPPKEKK